MSLLKIQPFSVDTTSTFTFGNANVTGNLVSGNASLGNLATANFFSGNGSLLTSLTGANVTGQVANALVAGTVYTAAQTNITSLGTLTGLTSGGTVNLTTASNVTLGPVANIHISGGSNGYFLQTDGSGGLTWSSTSSATGNANIAGSNTQVFFNDNGSGTLGTKSTFTFDKGTDVLTVSKISANGALLTNIVGANVDGNVSLAVQSHYANIANSVAGANVSGNVTSAVQSHYANIANSVSGTNVSGNVTWAITSNWANTANAVSGTNVSGNVTSAVQAHYANIANSVAGADVSGQVANANVAYYEAVTTQTTGTFYPVFVNGNTTANYALASNTALSFNAATGVLTTGTIQSGGGSGGNITGANLVSANFFSGSGSLLTSITGANVSGNVTSAVQSHYANIANAVAWSGVSSTPTTLSGYGITDSYSNTNAGAYLSTYTGNLAGTNLAITGNLTIGGTTTSVNSTVTRVVDPIFELGGGANGTALSTDDNKDRGLLLHYYSGGAVDAFMGWDDSNVEFGVGSNVSVTGEVVTWNNYGNLRAGYFLGNGSQLTGVSASSSFNIANGTSNVNIATINGNVTVGVGGTAGVVTITTTGVDVSGTLNSTGNLTASNANLGNLATANFFTGNGSLLTSITGTNVSGNVSSAVQSHYANIANSVAGTNVSGQVANALVAGTVYTAAQPNITSVGTLTSLAVSGTTNLGAVANVTITGGSANYFLKTDGSGVLSFASVPTTSLNVDTYTGDGSFTMKTLTVTPASIAYTLLAIGGVFQPRSAYSLSGAVITFSDPPPNGAIVEVTTIVAGAAGGGGSGNTTNALTIGTGLSGTSFNGSAAVTVAIDGTVATLTGSQTLTNKTLSSGILTGTLTAGGSVGTNGQILTSTVTGVQWSAAGASWTYSAVSANTSAVAGYRYIVDTATANLTITLPASGTLGDEVMIIDGTGNASTHAMTIDRNGGKIQGAASNMTVTTDRAAFTLVYYNNTQGWLLTNV